MRMTALILTLLTLTGCGVKPNFPKAPPDSPPPNSYPNPASDPKPTGPSTENR